MTYENIPAELKQLPQWVCTRADKVPLDPKTGRRASVTDSATWGTFEEATATALSIGFVFTKDDPYCFVDLDDPYAEKRGYTEEEQEHYRKLNKEVFNFFEGTYAELSVSGRGAHIIGKAKVLGCRRDTVEFYSESRYAIFTGNTLRALPITDMQAKVDEVVAHMGVLPLTSKDPGAGTPSSQSDEQVIAMGMRATNAEKFDVLWRGSYAGYPSQSEADYALLSMLAFYTTDNEQVRRLFRLSGLGKRLKSTKNDYYLNMSLAKVRQHEPPPVEIALAPAPRVEVRASNDPKEVPAPPGFVGDLARYLYWQSPRPVPQISLIGALAMFAGIIGRSYNISGTGLNQYLVLLASTGTGKESIAYGIDRIFSEVRKDMPGVMTFRGPAKFASAPALVRYLSESSCFVSVMGELGKTLKEWSSPYAPPSVANIRQVLLDVYNKSGQKSGLAQNVYSDKTKDTKWVQSPNVTIVGESTPETFYESLSMSHVSEGLVPRFSIVEYTGKRVAENEEFYNCDPPAELLYTVKKYVAVALNTQNQNTVQLVRMTSEAKTLLRELGVEADDHINNGSGEAEKQLWNRAKQKALKLAGLIAVGCNAVEPYVDISHAQWAMDFVYADIRVISEKFDRDEIGMDEVRGESVVKRAMRDWMDLASEQRAQYQVPQAFLQGNYVPFGYLRRRMRRSPAFTNQPGGATRAIDATLADLMKAGIIQRVPVDHCRKAWKTESPIYVIGPAF